MEDRKTSPSPTDGRHLLFPSKDLALLWRIPFPTEIEPDEVEFALRERIKELNCLYGVSQLAERNLRSVDNLLMELVNFLPYSWQYPETTCARVLFKGKTYKSDRFKVTRWRQSSRIYMYHEPVGEVSIVYLEEYPPADASRPDHPVEIIMHNRIAQPADEVLDIDVLLLVTDHVRFHEDRAAFAELNR